MTAQPTAARRTLTIGTRGSKLALVQTAMVRDALLARTPGLEVLVETITTRGDVLLDRPLAAIGGRGLFVTQIEEALRAGRIDLAVHSAKDLPSALPADLTLAALLPREDARDVLISRFGPLANLPPGARVGTSSPRRICALRAARPDLLLADVRGNVDTRLRKLHAGEYDALVLAAAGLLRLGLAAEITEWLAPEIMLPAVGQGALAVEIRAADTEVATLLAPLNDAPTAAAVSAERAFLFTSGGGCTAAIAALATLDGDTLTLAGMIGATDGRMIQGVQVGPVALAAQIGAQLAALLLAQGGSVLLTEADPSDDAGDE